MNSKNRYLTVASPMESIPQLGHESHVRYLYALPGTCRIEVLPLTLVILRPFRGGVGSHLPNYKF